jgi:hypothetical protein
MRMLRFSFSHLAHIAFVFSTLAILPNCIHSFRISPERAINQALDVQEGVQHQFGAALEIIADAPESRKNIELQSHVIMTMQEIGQNSKGYFDWLFDVDHDYELFPFVYYQKMIDAYVGRLVGAQKNLVSCKYSEQIGRRMQLRIEELEDEIGDLIYQLKAVRKFVVSHERYWAEKEKLERREQNRRELLLKKERNAIEREKLYLEREKLKNKHRLHDSTVNLYDVTVVQYYD